MKKVGKILLLLFTLSSFGQKKLEGIYSDRFGEKLELKSDATFTHTYRFDLATSWSTGKWKIANDTIYLTTELVMDTLQMRNHENREIKDSLVLSADRIANGLNGNGFLVSTLSSGGQNRIQPPSTLYRKGKRLYRLKKDGTLDLEKFRSFSNGRKYKTYFRKE